LPENGQEKPLRELLFPEVLGEVVQGETLVALPVVLHIQNTAFYNASIYRELGLEPPASWQAFIRQARHISAAGFTPLALSAEAWQLRMLFNDILLEVLGAEGFRRFYDETRAIASQRQALRTALDYFLQLRHFVDDPKQQRRWNETVALLARQRAAMLVLGDFVTAELMTAGLKAGDDFLCALAPGSSAVMLYALDSFILLNVDEPYLQAGQQLLVDTVLNPQVQAAFSTRKGGIPVRYGVKADDMDSCTAERYRVWSQPETRKLQPPDSSSRLRLALLEQAVQHIWLEIGSVEQALEHLLHQLDD
ncbi:MAG: extracellular solute-binding protein, partial [Thiothrix sp.]|nr:extracellular solute-binding protein [Thiothrix sp.]